MSRPFVYVRAESVESAVAELAAEGAVVMGGGTDLLVQADEDLVQPDVVVDVRGIAKLQSIELESDGSLRIGSAVSIDAVSRDPRIVADYPVLAQACSVVATPALRNMGTLGGNLCQRPRCWYYRRQIPCLKNGGSVCPAKDGENHLLSILDGGPCFIVHPSDPAVALTALGASVEITSEGGRRNIPIDQFYVLPRERIDRETVLVSGEMVTAVTIPALSRGGKQFWTKLMQRGAWDFALVSIAAVTRADGDVRIVLGGVAPRPWRVNISVEEDVASGGLDEDSIAALAERALYDAKPLSQNGYKVDQAGALIREALRFLGR
jgi:xanthine dehydrogenase YagS FAD-binding subunit